MLINNAQFINIYYAYMEPETKNLVSIQSYSRVKRKFLLDYLPLQQVLQTSIALQESSVFVSYVF
jgi:hypothetical protein